MTSDIQYMDFTCSHQQESHLYLPHPCGCAVVTPSLDILPPYNPCCIFRPRKDCNLRVLCSYTSILIGGRDAIAFAHVLKSFAVRLSFNVFTMTAVNIECSLHFTYDFIVLSDGMTMRSYTPVSFIKAIRNLFDVCLSHINQATMISRYM